MTQPIRVLIVDDHTLFRSGIKALLLRHKNFEVVGEAGDGLEGLKRAKSLQPNVVLLDLHMPGITGREAVQLIVEEVPETRVVMLTVSEDAEDLVDCLRAGASGYLLKNIETDYLIDAIQRVANGESIMSPQMTGKLVREFRTQPKGGAAPQPGEEHEKLSPREKEIITHLARGASNKEVARALGVAESTVKIHVQSILKKLNLTSRVQAAVYAVEHGLVPKEEL
ncbi:MAG: response regulator transcription factor [Betaproteobacteria bacterium]|nr:response regulator transcription factor [Betaproteobacteria bacterium]